MKKLAIGAAFLFIAFLGGYGPERYKRAQAESAIAQTRTELEAQRSRVRLGAILGHALALKDAVAGQNYGIARTASSGFFDAARDEAVRTTEPAFKSTLDEIVKTRDTLTSALTQGDPASLEMVRGIEMKLRQALGYEMAKAS